MMQRKAAVMLSGGLDSTLALRILQEQGIEVEAINFRTAFACCKDEALETARKFGVKVTVLSVGDDYFQLVEKPKYGWGKGINPCVDCRIYMFRLARRFMDSCGASFVASGEVVGQRPMSQQRHQLRIIEEESGLTDRLLRPLSAKLLEPTWPEREGIVDRERLYGIEGRSRKELLELAKTYGIENPPTPSTGCLLTEPDFADKVRDLFQYRPSTARWDFETLKVGRHFRLSPDTKIILGRNQEENERLESLQMRGSVLVSPVSFKGPSALVIGSYDDEIERKVCGMILHYSKMREADRSGEFQFECRDTGNRRLFSVSGEVLPEEELISLRI